jgi:hypothetical protein
MNHIKIFKLKLVFFLTIVFLTGCATYYMKTIKFQESVLSGDMEKADKLMEKDKKGAKGRNAILHYLNYGYVKFMLKDFQQSNQLFTQADNLIEDQQKNYAVDALALMTNPMVRPYKPEDFEVVMLNYFTAMNYLSMGQEEDALVECKRVNIKLNKLNDKYGAKKNRYQNDAFAHLLMGLIYDSQKDYNNAFIAYRNAYEAYESDYAKYFNVHAPEQLKIDLIRTARLTGFYDEAENYENKFNIKYKQEKGDASLIFIWLNGFGPVKSEWSVNFTTVRGQGGMVTFANDEYGLSFPFYMGNMSNTERAAFSDLSLLRVAFPKYVERKPYYSYAEIENAGLNYKLQLAENINEIAFKTLNDRMLREFGTSLLRLAIKKSLEELTRKQNQNAGAVLSLINAFTEKADTRNWQTLPYSFSYTRIPINQGENTYNLKAYAPNNNSREYTFKINAEKGKTYFQSFHNLESLPPDIAY